MAGNEDVDGDVSGEEAAWRDLVARFDEPVDTDAEQAPWPARENLTETARERQRPDQDSQAGWDETSPGTGSAARPGPASLPSLPAAGSWPGEPEPDQPRPAAAEASSSADGPPAEGGTVSETAVNGTASPPPPRPAERPRIIRRAGPGRPDQEVAAADSEDEDDRYIPPPPDPLPPLDPVAKAAWAGVLLGPGYLLIGKLADWYIPSWAALLAIVAFVAGFGTLVVRMGDKPRDDDDDGAVV